MPGNSRDGSPSAAQSSSGRIPPAPRRERAFPPVRGACESGRGCTSGTRVQAPSAGRCTRAGTRTAVRAGCGSGRRGFAPSGCLQLPGRATGVGVRAEDTTVALPRTEHRPAAGAAVEVLARVGGHRLAGLMPAERTCDRRFDHDARHREERTLATCLVEARAQLHRSTSSGRSAGRLALSASVVARVRPLTRLPRGVAAGARELRGRGG
jgi:hypothetical protein